MSENKRDGNPRRLIVAVIAIVVIIFAVMRVVKTVEFRKRFEPAQDAYLDARSSRDFAKVKQQFQALRDIAPAGKPRRLVEAGIAGCEARVVWHQVCDRPSVAGYRDAIARMERARELSGDEQGIWARDIEALARRLDAALGPKTVEELRQRSEALKRLPFEKAQSDIMALYRWREIWRQQDLHLNDAAREAVFREFRGYIESSYCRMFEEAVRKAQQPDADLAAKAAPLLRLVPVKTWSPVKAKEYEGKYPAELEAARAAKKELERLAEQDAPAGP